MGVLSCARGSASPGRKEQPLTMRKKAGELAALPADQEAAGTTRRQCTPGGGRRVRTGYEAPGALSAFSTAALTASMGISRLASAAYARRPSRVTSRDAAPPGPAP